MRTSEKTEQVAASLFAVGRDITPPKKNAKADTGKFSYTYLDLPALIEHLRPLLASWQLYITQEVTGGQGFVEITTTIWHLSGQFIELGPTFIPAQGDAQQTGKAITYGRRYSLAAALNIAADEDDDAKPRSGQARPRSDWGQETAPVTSGGTKAMLPPDREAAPVDDVGEGAATGAVSHYLNKDDQGLLKIEYGSPKKALDAYRARFGERIKSLGDVTYEMRDKMTEVSA